MLFIASKSSIRKSDIIFSRDIYIRGYASENIHISKYKINSVNTLYF